jgi:hypothetical protein
LLPHKYAAGCIVDSLYQQEQAQDRPQRKDYDYGERYRHYSHDAFFPFFLPLFFLTAALAILMAEASLLPDARTLLAMVANCFFLAGVLAFLVLADASLIVQGILCSSFHTTFVMTGSFYTAIFITPPAFSNHIFHVVDMFTNKQVVGVNTGGVVTTMQDTPPFRH